MPLSNTAKIGIVVAIALCITIPTIVILALPQGPTRSGPVVTFFGSTVAQNVSVYYSEITSASLNQKINSTLGFVKSSGSWESHKYTGVSLWDLIVYSAVSYGAATAVRFIGSDAYASPAFPLKLVQQNPELVLLAYEQDGISLNGNVDGPYKTIVNHSILAPQISSKYASKKVVSIEFLNYPDWNITIMGNVKENITIYYSQLMTYGYTMLNELINYTNNIRNYTGISVKSILSKQLPSNYVINTTAITSVRFIGADLYATQLVSYPWIYEDETDVLVAYARDFVLLDPANPGYLVSVVDYSLTAPTSSGQYYGKYLAYIQLI